MTLENLQQALGENNEELIKRLSFANKDVLKNFSIDKDGNVLYNGEKIISDIKISDEAGNFIEQREDGIYVGRDEQLVDRIDSIKLYQKYVNVELEYQFCSITPTPGDERRRLILQPNNFMPFFSVNGNMDVTPEGYIQLHGGKTYNITYGTYIQDVANSYCTILLFDITHNRSLQHQYVFSIDSSHNKTPDADKTYIYSPTEDCLIGIFVGGDTSTNLKNGIYFGATSNKNYIAIQEIGHDIIIDPMEYVNGQQGLEDTPVGHILSYMGNTPPKHYMNCNGAEYDILEYPYLAEHIREQFGKYNYFGGDGVKTFRVPDLRGEFLRGYGTASRNTGSGAEVGVHQDPTRHANIFGNQNGTFNTFHNENHSATPDAIDKEIGSATNRTFFNKAGTNTNYLRVPFYTSRPTNTAVMYCIKYEPTYYYLQQNVIKEISSLDYLEKHADLEGVPVGHILSFMGNKVPKHYLSCNGAVYNISDYPLLAEHINLNFGKYNYFGGNGTTTFAVPDLRGEFLRGTGTAARNTGKGANVGVHQDATKHVRIGVTENDNMVIGGRGTSINVANVDSSEKVSSRRWVNFPSGTSDELVALYTARPTNTAVMYCIKYEPTYAFLKQEDIEKVSDDELQQAIADTIKILKGDENSDTSTT